MKCNICPRQCNVNRNNSVGFCSASNSIYIAKYMIHKWEEPIISGTDENFGSGAIFFSGCNLKCIYCQNYEISNSVVGKSYSVQELANLFKKLEKIGALNINLVTPTHYTDKIIEALKIYKPKIPVVWNSSGYEKPEEIKKLKDFVDIYLVDLKYMNSTLAQKLSNAPDYPQFATKAILQMKKNQPKDILEDNLMQKGVIIRHLVIPNEIENSLSCLNWINENLDKNQYISIMAQYTPCYKAMQNKKYNRPLHIIEYKRVLSYLNKLNFKNGFVQELDSASTKFIPNFNN